MFLARLAPLGVLTLLAGAKPTASTLTIVVTSEPTSPSGPLRVIASAGTIVAAGQSYRATTDTLRVVGSAELTTQGPVMVATFIADSPGGRIRAAVRENGVETLVGQGEAVVVVRTPHGPQLEAMAASQLQKK